MRLTVCFALETHGLLAAHLIRRCLGMAIYLLDEAMGVDVLFKDRS